MRLSRLVPLDGLRFYSLQGPSFAIYLSVCTGGIFVSVSLDGFHFLTYFYFSEKV